jgi:hypothetical protein
MATYDPCKLIDQVRELLQVGGIEVQPTNDREAQVAAGQLLRSMGVFPAVDAVAFYARGDSASWTEADDRNAAAFNDRPAG